jgi:hypothetical protein
MMMLDALCRGTTEDGDDHQKGYDEGGLGHDYNHESHDDRVKKATAQQLPRKFYLERTEGGSFSSSRWRWPQGKHHFVLRPMDFLLIIYMPSPQSQCTFIDYP